MNPIFTSQNLQNLPSNHLKYQINHVSRDVNQPHIYRKVLLFFNQWRNYKAENSIQK